MGEKTGVGMGMIKVLKKLTTVAVVMDGMLIMLTLEGVGVVGAVVMVRRAKGAGRRMGKETRRGRKTALVIMHGEPVQPGERKMLVTLVVVIMTGMIPAEQVIMEVEETGGRSPH